MYLLYAFIVLWCTYDTFFGELAFNISSATMLYTRIVKYNTIIKNKQYIYICMTLGINIRQSLLVCREINENAYVNSDFYCKQFTNQQ